MYTVTTPDEARKYAENGAQLPFVVPRTPTMHPPVL
jgi:hypothetical protein